MSGKVRILFVVVKWRNLHAFHIFEKSIYFLVENIQPERSFLMDVIILPPVYDLGFIDFQQSQYHQNDDEYYSINSKCFIHSAYIFS